MRLAWRPVQIGDGPTITTSLTEAETARLRELASGKRVLEIGSAYGYSAVVMGQVAAHVLAVDPHEGYGSLPDSLHWMRKSLTAYGVADKVAIMLARSADALAALRATGAEFDLVFIDGDHRQEAVTKDLLGALELIHPRGVIACHDFGEDSCPGVMQAICEVDRTVGATACGELVDTLWVS